MTIGTWQPIKTAPKDGTRILLFWPYWRKRHAVIGFYDRDSVANNKWEADCALDEGPLPTHWMPLPDPPKDVFGE